ncbi:hypothetical protein C5167_043906 [Papaver somniferum]|uniref:Uncharacterized protein n=1 Tax=Papaver somniferum TaxID=3469 RepID=A0A4Y7LAX9_PAPSO|nr:hypothetical protein C5167_043906 [Papaver somniferum]
MSIPKTNENFHLLYDTKGRFRLHSMKDEEAKFTLARSLMCILEQRADDTIRHDLESNKINFIKFEIGIVVMVIGRRNRDRVGVIKNREKHKGSFDTLHIQDNTDHEFATCLANVFNNGKGSNPWVTLPKGKGIKLIIIKEARERLAAQGSATS